MNNLEFQAKEALGKFREFNRHKNIFFDTVWRLGFFLVVVIGIGLWGYLYPSQFRAVVTFTRDITAAFTFWAVPVVVALVVGVNGWDLITATLQTRQEISEAQEYLPQGCGKLERGKSDFRRLGGNPRGRG